MVRPIHRRARRGKRVDIAIDRYVKEVPAQVRANPSPENCAKYPVDHARMIDAHRVDVLQR
ncbi:hypothetical protein [Paraburkholderia heleia]|uniref:hypothetical protein n=1 Tax=Paraburkholderia heleia TaxID=634127 RepID=UPI0031D7A856